MMSESSSFDLCYLHKITDEKQEELKNAVLELLKDEPEMKEEFLKNYKYTRINDFIEKFIDDNLKPRKPTRKAKKSE